MSAGHAMERRPKGGDLKPVIDAATAALELENQRADRLDSKARDQMTIAGSWFAVVQAVAAIALASAAVVGRNVHDAQTPVGWVIAIAVTAAAGGIALLGAMRESTQVWKLRDQPAITQETLEDMVQARRDDPEHFEEQLVLEYRHLLGYAQKNNETRANALDAVAWWWWATLALGLLELILALIARIVNG